MMEWRQLLLGHRFLFREKKSCFLVIISHFISCSYCYLVLSKIAVNVTKICSDENSTFFSGFYKPHGLAPVSRLVTKGNDWFFKSCAIFYLITTHNSSFLLQPEYLPTCYACKCIWSLRALTGGRCVKGPAPKPLVLSSDHQRNPPHHVSFPPVHASPPGGLTAAAAHRGPLVKPCCHTPWHLLPSLCSKCQNHCSWIFDFYLFMWCFISQPPSLLNNFQNIQYVLNTEQPACVRGLSGGCHVSLVCYNIHSLINAWAWRWRISVSVCQRVFMDTFVFTLLHHWKLWILCNYWFQTHQYVCLCHRYFLSLEECKDILS